MLDKLQIASLVMIAILPILHFLGDDYLQNTNSSILQNQVIVIPIIFSAFGSALFLIKGGLSYKAIERMISKAAVVDKYYKTKIITNTSLQSTVLFSDLTAFYGLAMYSFVFAYGHLTNNQLDTYHWVQIYAYVFIPIVSVFSIWLERRSSASRRDS